MEVRSEPERHRHPLKPALDYWLQRTNYPARNILGPCLRHPPMARINPLNPSLAMVGEKSPPLDKILSSSGRIRILTLLSKVEQLHLTEIAKRTDQSYSAAERHLDDLSQAGIVEERDYGRVRVFKLNLANDRAKLSQELILKWNHNQELGQVQAQA